MTISMRNKSLGRKCGIAIGLFLCVALIGCGQKDKKTQSASAPSSPTEAQNSDTARPAAKYSTVRVEGNGKTFDDALQNALVLAVEEVNGSRVSKSINSQSLISDYHSQASSSGQFDASAGGSAHANATLDAHSTGDGGAESLHGAASADSQAKGQVSGKFSYSGNEVGSFDANKVVVNATSATVGAVRRFQVVSQKQNHGLWDVTIDAEIPVYEASAASKRLKIAVLPFRLASADKVGNEFEESVRSQVVDALSQSGKVAVLDRDYTQENQREISQLQGEDFSKDEASKLGNRLGADFIVVGTVSKAGATQASMYLAAVGKHVYSATHADAQLTFRLIEAATGVVQLSGTLDGPKYVASSLDAVAKAEAADLTNRILESLYPLRIESVSDGVFYLGKGGDSIHVGDEFRLVRQGDAIRDSDTHEVIGHSEKEMGKIIVTEVEPRLSKAKLADGAAPQTGDAANLIVRRVEHSESVPIDAVSDGADAHRSGLVAAKPLHKSKQPPNDSVAKPGVDY